MRRTTSPYERRRPARAPFLVSGVTFSSWPSTTFGRSRRRSGPTGRPGYRKPYTPRSMLWFGGIFFILFIAFLLVIFTSHLP
jgi:hypothetical protein